MKDMATCMAIMTGEELAGTPHLQHLPGPTRRPTCLLFVGITRIETAKLISIILLMVTCGLLLVVVGLKILGH